MLGCQAFLKVVGQSFALLLLLVDERRDLIFRGNTFPVQHAEKAPPSVSSCEYLQPCLGQLQS